MDLEGLKKALQGTVELGVALAPETTYRLGGRAAALAEPDDEREVASLMRWVRENGARFLFLGGGSNVLVADEGFDGVVIRPGAGLRTIRAEGDTVKAGAGAPLAAVVHKAAEAGLGGLEFCAGIPGTVGGAVVGNAGGKEGWIGERVVEMTVVTSEGETKVLSQDAVNWSYRYSSLKGTGSFLARVLLRLPRGSKEEIRRASRDYWDSRKGKQPLGRRNAGSTFKNPPGQFAGKLLEEAGMKGFRSGGAVVSDVHANFINHEEGGTARDVVAVMREAQKRVLDTWKIRLEPEILPLGDWTWKEVGDVWWNLPQGWFR